ncbi:glycosyltransferase family 4 protein [Hyphomicrobium sp. 99]|uniref:glycosyltransferase family 4 protein n=1 Tax=Hyphomicrobium sp. 99 TaxID=1163419 RepID=UPI0009E1EF6D|nr:glycosyltransferase family 4 protein [Hyphomicrobium sp. 99]
MRILMFLPRHMRFGPSNASSIDLCVRDLIAASRYRDTTTVVCCENETLFSEIDVMTYSRAVDDSRRRKVAFAVDQVARTAPDLIVVQQHLPTAAALALRTPVPVVLHKHNMIKPIPSRGLWSAIRRRLKLNQYRSLAGMIFVSDICRKMFVEDWPEVRLPSSIVYNGLDFSHWQPSTPKLDEIICVGRAAPEKGIKEAALAVVSVLKEQPSWRARFILSEPDRFPTYLEEVLAVIRPMEDRVTVLVGQPFAVVKEHCQNAAIAIIPSKWKEPFGRTALEAHAAGCAVVSSGTGGLSEIAPEQTLLLPPNFTADHIAELLRRLVLDHEFRVRLASAGRDHCAQKFALSAVAREADDFYELAVAQRTSGLGAAHALAPQESASAG